MVQATRSSTQLIVSLDVGSSSVRTRAFREDLQPVPELEASREYKLQEFPDGGVEVDPDAMLRRCIECLDETHAALLKAPEGTRVAGVAVCTFWHSFLGVDGEGRPVTPILHLLDTRAEREVEELKSRLGDPHPRTGCMLHTSYWPARLLWLSRANPRAFASARSWISPGEYLFQHLFGEAVSSTSMVSASGLWNQNAMDYDAETLAALPIDRGQLAAVDGLDRAVDSLTPEFGSRWPKFNGISWFPALGDGACSNVGSGCYTPDRFTLMVGTTGAMRAVLPRRTIDTIPKGVWCYRVGPDRLVLGGALSNGGRVFGWMTRDLSLKPEGLEEALASSTPGDHGLTLLPFLAGERSTGWRPDARAAIAGLTLSSGRLDLLRAGLEAVATRFRLIYDIMESAIGQPRQVIASGQAMVKSPGWTQLMADALGREIHVTEFDEATGLGAALLAFERLGMRSAQWDPPDLRAVQPRGAATDRFNDLLQRHKQAYEELVIRN